MATTKIISDVSVDGAVKIVPLNGSKALASSSDGTVVESSTTATELGYVHGVTNGIQAQIDGKQATLTFDSTPTTNSDNPVKSGGLYNELRIQSTDVLIDVDWTTLQIVDDDSDYRILPGSFAGKYVRIVNLPISNMQILYMLQSEWLSTPSKVVYICSADKAIGIRGFYESAFNIAVFPDSLHKYTINTPFTENGVDYICPLEAESFTPTTTSLKEFVKLLDSRISSEETAISGKQDALTFDDAPTANSGNVVKSGGVKVAIDSPPRFYLGTCSTAGNVAVKQVDIADFPTTLVNGVETPIVGSVIAVKFANNDAATSEQKKIKVNNTNAYPLWYDDAEVTSLSASNTRFGRANRFVYYVFNGTHWVWAAHGNDNDTTYTAGSGLKLSSSQFSLNVPRVTKSANSLPGINTAIIEEYNSGSAYNLPSTHFYHILTFEGSDSAYATQLALGMTTAAAYYRNYTSSTWGSWLRLDNPSVDSTPTASSTNPVQSGGTKTYVDEQVATKSSITIRQWVTE